MSLFDSYDENRTAILNPWNVYSKVGGFPETVIITFGTAILEIARELYDCQLVEIPETGGGLRVYRFADSADPDAAPASGPAKSAGICRVPMGAPMTVAYMEECIALGAKNFVVFGSCCHDSGKIPGCESIPVCIRGRQSGRHRLGSADHGPGSIQCEGTVPEGGS